MSIPKSFEELGDWIANQTSISVQDVLLCDPNGVSGDKLWMPRKCIVFPHSGEISDSYMGLYGVTLTHDGMAAVRARLMPPSIIQNAPLPVFKSFSNISVYTLTDIRYVVPTGWVDDSLGWTNYVIERMAASLLNTRNIPTDVLLNIIGKGNHG